MASPQDHIVNHEVAPGNSRSITPTEEGVYSHEVKDIESGELKKDYGDGTNVNVLETTKSGSSPEGSTESLTMGQKRALFYRKYRWVMHVFIWMVMTG